MLDEDKRFFQFLEERKIAAETLDEIRAEKVYRPNDHFVHLHWHVYVNFKKF